MTEEQLNLIKGLRLLLTDVDGVLTDNGVYYSAEGELLKRFSIRDGMGTERLRKLCGIDTGIITGETSGSVVKRAEKLKITELHLGIRDKMARLREIMEQRQLKAAEIAYIGDDVNDLDVMKMVGISACPADAMQAVKDIAVFTCRNKGGEGAYREVAEWLIFHRQQSNNSSR